MKNILTLAFMFLVFDAMAVCSSSITRTNNGFGLGLSSAKYNLDLNTVYARANELPGDCITTGTVTTTQILNGTLVNADISTGASISRSKLGTVNYVVSTSGSGSFTTSSTTYVDVTNLTASITTTGNPVEITLTVEDVSQFGYYGPSRTGATLATMSIKALRDATNIGQTIAWMQGASGNLASLLPYGSLRFIDTPAAGTYTYKLQALVDNASTVGTFSFVKLMVREL